MGCPCGGEANQEWIPLWYHHSCGQGHQGHKEGPTQEQPCRMHRSKGRTYPELLHLRRPGYRSRREVDNEASNFTRMLANARGRSGPSSLQAATRAALVSRWSALLTHAARCPSQPTCCLKTFLPTTTCTEISQPSAISLPTLAAPCVPASPVAEALVYTFPPPKPLRPRLRWIHSICVLLFVIRFRHHIMPVTVDNRIERSIIFLTMSNLES